MSATSKKYALDFLSFVNASPTRESFFLELLTSRLIKLTAFHAVDSAKQRLLKAGFCEIRVYPPHPLGKKKDHILTLE